MSSYDPFDETRQQLEQLKQWGSGNRNLVIGLLLAVVVVGAAASAYYQVEADEVAVVLRFGKYHQTTQPGLRFRLPFGIDKVYKVPVERQQEMEFGYRTARPDVLSEQVRDRRALSESKMLTADLNVAKVEWSVLFKAADPEKWIFRFRDGDVRRTQGRVTGMRETLGLMSEAAMRAVVGDYTLDELLTRGREEIAEKAREKLAELNERYGTGIIIEQVALETAYVQPIVEAALKEVEESKQEKARMINLAETEYNKTIPRAKGRADEAISAAKGYREERVNQAIGDAERFVALYDEYRKAKEVTRTRLYFEAMSTVLPRVKRKIVVDDDVKGVLPLLNLDGRAK